MFGNKSLPSRIYSYGSKAPHLGAEEYSRQLGLQRKYRNRLIEIEHERRQSVDALLNRRYPDVADSEARLKDAQAALDDALVKTADEKRRTRKRSVSAPIAALVKAARAVRKQAAADRKAARQVAFADLDLRADLDAIDEESEQKVRDSRAVSGLYWCNYLQIEQAMAKARKGAPPQFRRWNGNGSAAVQIQHGCTWDEATSGAKNQLQVEMLPPGPNADPNSRRSREKLRARVRIRVGRDDQEYAESIVRLHRPIPAEAKIKWAKLHRRRIGSRADYAFQFTISQETWHRNDLAADGVVAINLGWRKLLGTDMRVGYIVGEDGHEQEVRLPKALLSRWSKSDSLQQIRKLEFNKNREALALWLKDHEVPEWLREITEHIDKWLSPERMARVAIAWRTQRFEGDQDAFGPLEAWRKQDKHLWDWEASNRAKAIRIRDEMYRRLAARLSRRYHTLVIDDSDYSEMRLKPGIETEDEMFTRRAASISSCGRLRQCLIERFAESVVVDSKNVTKTCQSCKSVGDIDASHDIWLICPDCQVRFDQDKRAAINLLDVYNQMAVVVEA